jgi:rhomboid protease GluP
MPANEALLEQIDHEVRHDAAYTVAIHGVRRRPWITWGLIAANCAMFAVELAMGAYKSDDQVLIPLFARLGAGIVIPGEPVQWWRAITANFLHFGLAHLLMNMLALNVLGPFIEQFMGRWRYLVVYFTAGIGAVAGVMAWWTIKPPDHIDFLVGASGAIMGLVGAQGAIMVRGWLRDRAAIAARRLRVILLIVVVQVVFDNITPEVSGTAHMIGLVIGFIVTLLLMIGMGRMVVR